MGSLHPTRDYTYVTDTVEAFIKAAGSPRSVGEVANIGSNYEVSIGELVERIMFLIGKDFKIITDSTRIRPQKSEVERLWCDNTKARKVLGWSPTTPLDEGLTKTIEWISTNLDLYKPELYSR